MRFQTFLLAAASAVLSSARDDAAGLTEKRDTLTQDLYEDLKFYTEYTEVTMCNSGVAPNSPIKCRGGCQTLERNNATIIAAIKGLLWDLNALVVVDPARREIVGAIRGTATIRNALADVQVLSRSCPLTPGCRVHEGFAKSWDEIAEPFTKHLREAKAANPDYNVRLQGYSLGGSTAQLAAAYLRNQGFENMDIFTYGAPRVGNQAFVDYVMAQGGAQYRVTHHDDLAPTYVPLFKGYRHTFPEYWLEQGPSTRTEYAIPDIKVCTGTRQRQCNSAKLNLDIISHLYYFDYTLRCFPVSLRRGEVEDLMADEAFMQRMREWQALDDALDLE